jgi:hypothetical protein
VAPNGGRVELTIDEIKGLIFAVNALDQRRVVGDNAIRLVENADIAVQKLKKEIRLFHQYSYFLLTPLD